MSILVISNHNSFRVLFHKIAYVYFIRKIYLYFSIGNGQPMTSTVPIESANFRSVLLAMLPKTCRNAAIKRVIKELSRALTGNIPDGSKRCEVS